MFRKLFMFTKYIAVFTMYLAVGIIVGIVKFFFEILKSIITGGNKTNSSEHGES